MVNQYQLKIRTDLDDYLGLIDTNKLQLTKLKTKHKQIIVLHLSGLGTDDISDEVGMSPGYIRQVLKTDLAQSAIDDYFRHLDSEFDSLYVLAISAVRDALTSSDIELRLKAADKFFKNYGKRNAEQQGVETAEDFVRKIMEFRIVEERVTKRIVE